MTREEHLRFCKVCENSTFDRQKGIICKLTGDIANFEGDCADFAGDHTQIKVEVQAEKKSDIRKRITEMLGLFRPRAGFFVTPVLVYLCIFIFILMTASGVHLSNPDIDSLIAWGGNFRPLTLDGQYWRLVSNVFLHIGILHLLFNMYGLAFIGLMLEPIIGSVRLAIAYLITGIAASAVSVGWHELMVSAGASGAIFGLYGIYIALLLTNLMDKKTRDGLLPSLVVFVGYNLVYGMREGIDNAAHLGGLVSGIVLGFSLYPTLKWPAEKNRQYLVNGSAIVFIAGFVALILIKTPDDTVKYNMLMSEFVEHEQKALELYRVHDGSPDYKYLDAIEKDGIPNWQVCQKTVFRMDSLAHLPEPLRERAEILRRYCDFRILSYELISKSIKEHSRKYDFLTFHYNRKIELFIQKLKGESVADSLLERGPLDDLMLEAPKDILVVVNGQPVKEIADIDQSRIKSLEVVNSQVAVSIYGPRGGYGVVLVDLETK